MDTLNLNMPCNNDYKVFEKHWQQGSTEEGQKENLISSGANAADPEEEHQKGRNVMAHFISEHSKLKFIYEFTIRNINLALNTIN
jgi:hypothetical protein